MLRIRIPKSDLAHLERLRQFTDDDIDNLLAALAAETTTGRQHLASVLARTPEPRLDAEAADGVARVLVSLSLLQQKRRATAPNVLSAALAALRESGWTQDDLEEWQRRDAAIARLLDSETVKLAAKAETLSVEHGNLLDDCRILTDVRPVFDESASTVKAALVQSSLQLEYYGDAHHRSVSVAIDKQQIAALRDQCDRALEKIAKVDEMVRTRWEVPTRLSGDDDAT